MEGANPTALLEQLAAGFDALQDEYQKLFSQHTAVERKLATAREQYNELAKLCDSGALTTPPLSLSSSPSSRRKEDGQKLATSTILENRHDSSSMAAAQKVRTAVSAVQTLRSNPNLLSDVNSVKIWSGPSADRPEIAVSSTLPSISESPLEQDFTIEGLPSKLGCPFASMSKRKLSTHAASVLNRYNASGQGSAAGSVAASSVSRVNGKDSLSRRESRRASFVDPIKAEICGMSEHTPDVEVPSKEVEQPADPAVDPNAEPGVCPIRFLDQHSPEEVATYFENHKHELPRSHEICVRRYQSNESQIKELDEKYGNLVSMIQGLGAKHKGMLPEDREAEDEDFSSVDDEKVRKWASSVSAQAPEGNTDTEPTEEERQSHFDRPMRDVRIGESPSRPWGIQVPIEYLEKEAGSEASALPTPVPGAPLDKPAPTHPTAEAPSTAKPAGKCPFGFDTMEGAKKPAVEPVREDPPVEKPAQKCPFDSKAAPAKQQPIFVSPEGLGTNAAGMPNTLPSLADSAPSKQGESGGRTVFTGPVFIGYSAEDAMKVLKEWGR